MVIRLADETKQGWVDVVKTTEDNLEDQKDLNSLKPWTLCNKILISSKKCNVLYLSGKNYMQRYKIDKDEDGV